MRMEDPKPTFTYLVSRIKELYPKLSFIHMIEPRVEGPADVEPASDADVSLNFRSLVL